MNHETDEIVKTELKRAKGIHPDMEPPALPRHVGVYLSVIQGLMQKAFQAFEEHKDEGRSAIRQVVKIAATAQRCIGDHPEHFRPLKENCIACKGSGTVYYGPFEGDSERCPSCRGSGEVEIREIWEG